MKKKRMLNYIYFISQQNKTAHAFIVNFSTILAFFVYARKSCAVLELYSKVYRLFSLVATYMYVYVFTSCHIYVFVFVSWPRDLIGLLVFNKNYTETFCNGSV